MSYQYSLSRVIGDHHGEIINGWTGYTTDTYVKQWYFIDSIPMGSVEALSMPPATSPNAFSFSLGGVRRGGFADLDSAKVEFMGELRRWWAKANTDHRMFMD